MCVVCVLCVCVFISSVRKSAHQTSARVRLWRCGTSGLLWPVRIPQAQQLWQVDSPVCLPVHCSVSSVSSAHSVYPPVCAPPCTLQCVHQSVLSHLHIPRRPGLQHHGGAGPGDGEQCGAGSRREQWSSLATSGTPLPLPQVSLPSGGVCCPREAHPPNPRDQESRQDGHHQEH